MGMTIKRLELKNFQAIKDFTADFSGDVYLVKGENEVGKSTILKSIVCLLTGERDAVLRNGEKNGFAKMIIGGDGKEYTVELRFTESDPRGTISIKAKDGMRSTNVSMLRTILNYRNFDAEEFARWSETAEGRRKQINVVMGLMPPEIANRIKTIDAEVLQTKESRKTVNANVKYKETELESIKAQLSDGDIETYTEPIDLTVLMQESNKAAEQRAKAENVKMQMASLESELANIPKERERLAADLERAKKAYEDAKAFYNRSIENVAAQENEIKDKISKAEQWLSEYDAQPKEDAAEKLAAAQNHNAKCQIVKMFHAKQTEVDAERTKADKLNANLDAYAKERAELVAAAKFPIDGLSFGEDGLTLNDVPFVVGKVSDSQIMEVAAKLVIASNPTVNIFRIGRGESLGAKRLQSIVNLAKENGFQGFIEQVERGQETISVEEYREV
jgi:DNA repair exonuclease SbcCD ATPase subunit